MSALVTLTASPGATGLPTRGRKLHVGHFAFMRAVVQGLDARQSWARFLATEGDATDQRVVRSTIAWIRDEFAAAAKREDRHGTARLVQLADAPSRRTSCARTGRVEPSAPSCRGLPRSHHLVIDA